ncbi:MAG: GNAT family N-acetyltransferase [Candidatus Melainabacteria bacterium]|nr:MAG: GNAT family N-acetyltransferase [Candidatus Melainabacteria bacterium]
MASKEPTSKLAEGAEPELSGETLANGYFAKDQLPDGRVLIIRSIGPSDKRLLQEGMHHLSKRSRYNRFLTPKDELTAGELVYFTEIDMVNHVALGAILIEHGEKIPVGVARYVVSEEHSDCHSAEVAFAVDEVHQGQGVGTILFKHLTKIARSNGIRAFTALVLSDNQRMLNIFAHSGLAMKMLLNVAGAYEVRLDLS